MLTNNLNKLQAPNFFDDSMPNCVMCKSLIFFIRLNIFIRLSPIFFQPPSGKLKLHLAGHFKGSGWQNGCIQWFSQHIYLTL